MRIALAATPILIALATLVVVGCATSGGDEPELGALLDSVVAAGAPGVLVVVREDGKVRSEARGFADRSRSVRMRADERFRIGSITKTFVAALVLLLVEDGALRLDDTVERWLPGLVPAGRTITVRDLLSHTAGLFDYVEDDRVLRDHERRWTPRELVAIAAAHPPERLRPGGRFAYSSTNYLVLGLIVEQAGGWPLARQLRERLFGPLGLRRTTFVTGEIRGSHVHGHRSPSHQGVVTGPPVDTSAEPAWWTWAAGAIVDRWRLTALLCRSPARKSAQPAAHARDGDARASRPVAVRPRNRDLSDTLRACLGPYGERPGHGRRRLELEGRVASARPRREHVPALRGARGGGAAGPRRGILLCCVISRKAMQKAEFAPRECDAPRPEVARDRRLRQLGPDYSSMR